MGEVVLLEYRELYYKITYGNNLNMYIYRNNDLMIHPHEMLNRIKSEFMSRGFSCEIFEVSRAEYEANAPIHSLIVKDLLGVLKRPDK
jgi:hypothetical protein